MKKKSLFCLTLLFCVAILFSTCVKNSIHSTDTTARNTTPANTPNDASTPPETYSEFPRALTQEEMERNGGGYIFTNADNVTLWNQGVQSARAFKLNEMVVAKDYDENGYFTISNVLPHTFKDVSVYITANEFTDTLQLFHLDVLPRFFVYYAPLPMHAGDNTFKNTKGEVVHVQNANNLSRLQFWIKIKDPVFEKIKTITARTTIEFTEFQNNSQSMARWGKLTPENVRHYVGIIANCWYVYSSPEFKERFMNYSGRLYDDNNVDINRAAVFEKFLRHGRLQFSVVTNLSGIAGGHQFGLNANMHLGGNFYERKKTPSTETFPHEMGHVVGFDHSSNMTYPCSEKYKPCETGYATIFQNLYVEFLLNDRLPFPTNPNETQDANLTPQFKATIPFY